MAYQINQKVTIQDGAHKGKTGTVLTLPVGDSTNYIVWIDVVNGKGGAVVVNEGDLNG